MRQSELQYWGAVANVVPHRLEHTRFLIMRLRAEGILAAGVPLVWIIWQLSRNRGSPKSM